MDFKDEEQVKEYTKNLGIEYRFGCYSEKNPEVCHLLGDFLEAIKKDADKASLVYKANCDEFNFARSCYQFARLTMRNKNLSDAQKLSTAPPYFEKGCDHGSAESCVVSGINHMGKSKSDPTSYSKALDYFTKGCELGHPLGCFQTSGMYLIGEEKGGIKKDMNKAFKYAIMACDLNEMRGCANASIMYRKGEGTTQDLKKSEEYKTKALEIQKMYTHDNQGINFQQGT